jgi:hypothetical protein
MKINHGIDKYLLKIYAIKYLKIPKHIILRKKVGFSISLKKYYEYYPSYEYTNRLFSIALLLNWYKLYFAH